MKYPGGHQSTVFVEQVGTVTALFDQWNDCERTVVLYALLKRLPFPNLKFLQLSIEYNIAQNINSQQTTANNNQTTGGSGGGGKHPFAASANNSNFNKFHLLESNSNNGIFLTKLISVYKNFRNAAHPHHQVDLGHPPPPLEVHGRGIAYGIGNVPYETREDILNDILTYLPLLKPGNEEAKSAYISLVPLVVADSIKQLIPTEVVQQILSYLLIHPAVTSEDRRSLAQWLHHLEEHINSSYIDSMIGGGSAGVGLTTTPNPPGTIPPKMRSFSLTPTTKTGAAFASINEQGPMTTLNCWDTNASTTTPTTTGRSSSCGHPKASLHPNLLWELPPPTTATTTTVLGPKSNNGVTQDFVCDDHVIREFRKTIGRNMDGSCASQPPQQMTHGGPLKSTGSSTMTSKSSLSSVSSSVSSSSCSSTSSISSSCSGGKAATMGQSDSGGVFVVVPEHQQQHQQEDLHVSFSKNGTEILDFDCDDDNKSNTQIAFEAPPPPINPRLMADAYLAVPQHLDNCYCVGATPTGQCALLMSSNALKTRRSNSLTTAPVTVSYPGSGGVGGGPGAGSSSSTENLLLLKPRSYSLSIEGHRGSLMSCGSDTRLELDMKPGSSVGLQGSAAMLGLGKLTGGCGGGVGGGGGGNPGMNCIGQWLKSLRLHKYVWLFSNITYEQMLDITEEYLANLSVTKGARHKLVLCIQKLRERGAVLMQMEQSLLSGETHVAPMLEELTNIVLTPMKPIDPFSKDNIAGLFVKVIEMVGSLLVTRPVQGALDEEQVTAFLWILERALHNEAFLGQMNLLKELKFKVSKIKLQFVNKPHFGKSAPGGGGVAGSGLSNSSGNGSSGGGSGSGVVSSLGNNNKCRWTSGSGTATSVTGSTVKKPGMPGPERKNSGASLQSFSAILQQQQQQQQHQPQSSTTGQQNQQYNSKSSSYPSFSQNLKFPNPPHMTHLPTTAAAKPAANTLCAPPPSVTGQTSSSLVHSLDQPPPPPSVVGSGGNAGKVVSGGGGGQGVMYHRHSMNSLMPMGQPLLGGGLVGEKKQQQSNSIQQRSMAIGAPKVENNENIDIGNQQQLQQQCKDKNNICDINSRLEFLCLQMTEQAIN